jgi:hypothetical protein
MAQTIISIAPSLAFQKALPRKIHARGELPREKSPGRRAEKLTTLATSTRIRAEKLPTLAISNTDIANSGSTQHIGDAMLPKKHHVYALIGGIEESCCADWLNR